MFCIAAAILALQSSVVVVDGSKMEMAYGFLDGFEIAATAENGLMAGFYVTFYGNHGENWLSRPFVLSGNQLTWLPTSTYEYGQALATDGTRVVGHVSGDSKDFPSIWTREKGAWKLEVLDKEEGSAVAIGRDGSLYIDGKNSSSLSIYKQGTSRVLLRQNFRLVHIDGEGRLYGNRFTGYTFGMQPSEPRGAIYHNGEWQLLDDKFVLQFVKDKQLVGSRWSSGSWATVVLDGKLQRLPVPDDTAHSSVTALGSSGLIAGFFYTDDQYRPCIWSQGNLVEVGILVPNAVRGYILAITPDDHLIVAARQHGELMLVKVKAPSLERS